MRRRRSARPAWARPEATISTLVPHRQGMRHGRHSRTRTCRRFCHHWVMSGVSGCRHGGEATPAPGHAEGRVRCGPQRAPEDGRLDPRGLPAAQVLRLRPAFAVDRLPDPVPPPEADVVVRVDQLDVRDPATGQAPDDRLGGPHAGVPGRRAGHRQRPAVVADSLDAVADGVDVGVRDRPHRAIDHDPTGLGDLQPGGGGDRADDEPRRPHRRVGRQDGPVIAQHPSGFDGFDLRVLDDCDTQPLARAAQVAPGPRGEPGTQLTARDERHRQVRSGFGDLRGGLDAGQPVPHDRHACAFAPPARAAQAVQTLAQAQRRGPGGDVEGVLRHPGDAAVVAPAAERVHQRVVTDHAAAVGVGHGDNPALGVDSADPGHAQPDPRAREDVGEFRCLDLPAGRELVPSQPLMEVRHGVDHGDLGVRRGAGEIPGDEGSGVAGAEDDDAVLHVSLLSVRLLSVS